MEISHMKLFICSRCEDIVKLRVGRWRWCECGKSAGRYSADGDNAEFAGKAVPFGIGNGYFGIALRERAMFIGWFYGGMIDGIKIHYTRMPRRKKI